MLQLYFPNSFTNLETEIFSNFENTKTREVLRASVYLWQDEQAEIPSGDMRRLLG